MRLLILLAGSFAFFDDHFDPVCSERRVVLKCPDRFFGNSCNSPAIILVAGDRIYQSIDTDGLR